MKPFNSRYFVAISMLLLAVMIVHADDVVDFKEIDTLLAPIQSKGDLDAYLSERKGMLSPIDYLSPPAKLRFLASLRFNENGLSSFRYQDLKAELTDTQVYEIMSLFGAQHLVPMIGKPQSHGLMINKGLGDELGDHEDYSCQRRATCKKDAGYICMSSC